MAGNGSAVERLRTHTRLVAIVWGVYWVGLTLLLHLPKLPKSPIEISRRSLVAHFVTFFLLTAGCVLVRRARGGSLTNTWLAGWTGILVVYASASELLQPLSNRHRDIQDWVANVSAVVIVMLITRWKGRAVRSTEPVLEDAL